MATVIFDVDRSLSSIGPMDEVTRLCGGFEPIVVNEGVRQMVDILNDLFVTKVVPRQHPLITSATMKERVVERSPLCIQHGITAIAIDTFSHLQRNDLRMLENARPNKQMEIQDWGVIERSYNMALSLLKRLPIPVIVNSHTMMERDANGAFFINAALKGKAGDFINEYFDCVFYTHVSKMKDGTRVYSWQTKPDAMRKAKAREDGKAINLPEIIPQNFKAVIDTYAGAGYPAPKILIIGESGTGKSRALATLQS